MSLTFSIYKFALQSFSPTAAVVATAHDFAAFAFVLPPASTLGLWSHSN